MMNQNYIEQFNNTINHILDSYVKELKYSPKTVKDYRTVYDSLRIFLENSNEEKLSTTLIDAFIESEISNKQISRYRYFAVKNTCKVLRNYISTGKMIAARQLMARKDYTPLSFMKNELNRFFIAYQEKFNWAESTLDKHKQELKEFDEYIIENKIVTLDEKTAINYIKSINGTQHKLEVHSRAIRQFFTFLKEINYTDKDLAKSVPKIKFTRQVKLPSTYTPEEIEQLLKVSKAALGLRAGKRNYAMVLLAARLGLRASDIRNLRFTNIDWEQNTITFIQIKGKKEIRLPLHGDVGNAIIDYEANERPKSDLNNVFLAAVPPFENIKKSSTISKVVTRAFRAANIDISNRKKGSHTLRHSLASEMLNQMSPLHAISDTLGHDDLESAKNYLRIDANKLKYCALDIPRISETFYNQKYGKFFSKN